MKILLLDNYDSFTYNLAHLVEKVCGTMPQVRMNDAIECEEAGSYDMIILSPGPGLPSQAGVMPQILGRFRESIPVLGVCLGMQAIGESYGAGLLNLPSVCHGMAADIHVTARDPLFEGCPSPFKGGRYHSWVVDENTLPAELMVTARDTAGNIMALRHRQHRVCGVQFHPESVLSEHGERLIRNWIRGVKYT